MRVNPQVASLLEGRVAALSLINQGADLLTASGMEKARAAARNAAPEAPWAAFAALSSATSRIDSGSDVTLNSLNLLAGFGSRGSLVRIQSLRPERQIKEAGYSNM